MQQWLEFGITIEVARFVPKRKIRHKGCTCDGVFAQQLVISRQQREPAVNQASQQNQRQSREDAFDATGVEIKETEAAAFKILKDDGCNQKP